MQCSGTRDRHGRFAVVAIWVPSGDQIVTIVLAVRNPGAVRRPLLMRPARLARLVSRRAEDDPRAVGDHDGPLLKPILGHPGDLYVHAVRVHRVDVGALAPRGGSPSVDVKAIGVPSGDQRGPSRGAPVVIWIRPVPSGFTVQMSRPGRTRSSRSRPGSSPRGRGDGAAQRDGHARAPLAVSP